MSTYNKNGATVTITSTKSWTDVDKDLTSTQLVSGFDTSLDNISFSGKTTRGRPVVIAKVVITADSGKYFSSPPYLQTKSRSISLRLRDKVNQRLTVGDGVFYTSYTYDLLFSSRSKTSISNNLNAKINYTTKDIPTTTTEIKDIQFGSIYIPATGTIREIRVLGDKGADFALAINENYAETITIGDEQIPFFNKHNDESILRRATPLKTEYNYGKKISIIRDKIPDGGVYTFNQSFPSTESIKTEVEVAASSASKIKFKDLTNVRKGDRVYFNGIGSSIVTVDTLDPDGDDPSECTLLRDGSTASLTITKGKKVIFRRSKTYSIDIIPDLTSTLGSKIPTTDPEYKLYQYLDPVLTITHVPNTTGSSETKIEKYNDVDTGLAHSVNHTITYTGKANTVINSKNKKVKDKFSVKIRVTCESGGDRITAKKLPVFSNIDREVRAKRGDGSANDNAVLSNWTNSVASANGGTVVNITGIRVGPIDAQSIDIWYDVEIVKWGIRDVNMVLDTTNILTNT